MSVKVIKREYISPFALPTETEAPDWLLANTGDNINAKITVEAGVDYLASSSAPISINKEERTIKLMNGKKWQLDYGFDINRTIKFMYNRVTVTDETQTPDVRLFDVVIENVINDTMYYAPNIDMEAIPYDIIPTDRGTVKITGVKLYDEREVQGVRLKYTHIENAETQSHNLNSFIDGTITEAIKVGLNTMTPNAFYDMELIGMQSGMSLKTARIKKLSGAVNTDLIYNIPNTGEIFLDLPNNWGSIGQSIAMNGTTTPVAPMQNSVRADFTGSASGWGNRMFLYNADFIGTRVLDIRIGTTILNNYGGGDYKVLKILLYKFTGGTALSGYTSTMLAAYEVTNGIRGQQLIYDDTVTIDVQTGDSYALGYAWEISNPNPFLSPAVKFQTNFGSVGVLNVSESNYKTQYEIDLNYIMSSFWDSLEGLINREAPNEIFNANSLTDCFSLEFLPEWNNPNISIKNDMTETERLGNTGWFNENYNGLTNHFAVEEVKYTDSTGGVVAGLSYGDDIRIKAKISGVANLVNDVSKFTYGFIWVPVNEEQYREKSTGFHKNTKINTPENAAFALGVNYPFTYYGFSENEAKMNVKDVRFYLDGDNVVFEGTFSPTPEFRAEFTSRDNDRNYAIWVSVGDSTLVRNFSDRVSVLVDVNVMDFYLPVSGERDGVTNRFLEHPEAHDAAGVEIYDGFLEDDILSRVNFSLGTGEKLSALTLGYEAENVDEGTTFELDKFTIDTNSYIIDANGVQQIEFNAIRGFKLEPDNNKNWVKVTRDENSDSENANAYIIYFAAKIRWEDWLRKTGVPVEYYDNTLDNNGNNNNWLHYLRAAGNHKVNFFIYFDIYGTDGVLRRYKNPFNINFYDYDENPNIQTEVKYYDDETDQLLNIGTDPQTGKPLGILLSNKNTRIEILYRKLDGDWDIGNVYCATTLEIDKGAGVLEHRQLSSIWGREFDDILIPLDGQVKLLVEQITTNEIKASCLVDYTRLTRAYKYKITGRIGCFKNDNGVPITEKQYEESNYENKYE